MVKDPAGWDILAGVATTMHAAPNGLCAADREHKMAGPLLYHQSLRWDNQLTPTIGCYCPACKYPVVLCRAAIAGLEDQQAPVWLPSDSDRIWRGSYKGKDWKHLVCTPTQAPC